MRESVCISKFRAGRRLGAGELVVEWSSHHDSPDFRVPQAALELLARDFPGLLRHVTRIGRPR